jgi:hypothetical protein
MTVTPADYLPPANFQSAGYPVWQVIDGNLSIVDPTGTGEYGNLYVAGNIIAGGMIGGLVVVPVSGDTTGVTDTANITAALSTGYPVRLLPGEYWLTNLTFPASGAKLWGSGFQAGDTIPTTAFSTLLKAGSATASGGAMITIPVTCCSWEIRNLAVNGQQVGDLFPYTEGIIYLPDTTSVTNENGLIEKVTLENSGGNGIYLGHFRSEIHVDIAVIQLCPSGSGIYDAGSDNVITRCELDQNLVGATLSGEMGRMSDTDVYGNTNGLIISNKRIYVRDVSLDHQTQTALIVNSSAVGVTFHGRFIYNGTSSSGTYYHIDAHLAGSATGGGGSAGGTGSGPGGLTLAPGTMFCNPDEFGTAKVEYDIYTAGSPGLVNDYSTYDSQSYTVNHID